LLSKPAAATSSSPLEDAEIPEAVNEVVVEVPVAVVD
jgi:hypothetical protein